MEALVRDWFDFALNVASFILMALLLTCLIFLFTGRSDHTMNERSAIGRTK